MYRLFMVIKQFTCNIIKMAKRDRTITYLEWVLAMMIFLHLCNTSFSHIPSRWICSKKFFLRSLWRIKTWSVTWADARLTACSLCLAFSINLLKSHVITVKCHVTIMQWLAFCITSFVYSQSLCYRLPLSLPISDQTKMDE